MKKKKKKQRRIFFGNRKGGVGKTSLAILFAEWFSSKGNRVLLIDLDGQCNLSNRYLKMDEKEGNFYPPLHPDYNPETDDDWNGFGGSEDIYKYGDLISYPTLVETLEIVPASSPLFDIEQINRREVAVKIHDQLRDILSNPEIEEEYDIIIFDTSPSNGPITVSALRASTHMIIPFIPRKFSAEGLIGMFNLWARENRMRTEDNPLVLAGLIPTFTKRSKEMSDLMADIKKNEFLSKYLAKVKMNQWEDYAKLADSPEFSPFNSLSKNNKTRKQSIEICEYFEKIIMSGK